jgi:alkylresorcinol/alkylpyrone synthase
MRPSAKLVSLATAVPPNVLSQSDVAAAANQCFGGRYDEFERLARVFKSSAIRRRHAVRPIDWYLTPLGWPERATVISRLEALVSKAPLNSRVFP